MKLQTLENDHLRLTTLDYGAIIQELLFRDRHGKPINCVIGFQDLKEYLQDQRSFGACVGRFAGRISGDSIRIGDTSYPIHSQNGIHLHGGKKGLGRRIWKLTESGTGSEPFVSYEYISPHLEEGYPGELKVRVTYSLLGSTLRIFHEATTDRSIVVNLTNHSYFRLDEAKIPDGWWLQVLGREILETQEDLLPTGKLLPVAGTKYDFQNASPLGATRLDTPYVVDPEKDPKIVAWSTVSGIRLTIGSNQPAVVVYTPVDRPAICFETQNYPDAPNHPSFPSCILHPGETYRNESFFRFDLLP